MSDMKKQNKIQKNYIQGVLQGNAGGYAFLLYEGGDYFIDRHDLNGAMHGDEVICKEVRSRGHSRQAEVVKIISRGVTTVVGTFSSCKSGGFVISDDRRIYDDIFVPFKYCKKAKTGDKVTAVITNYPKKGSPEGKIVEILGRQFDFETEKISIERTFNLVDVFPKKVNVEAERISSCKIDKSLRENFTSETVITIDGEDARDFDDAVSVKKDGEFYLLQVHIADVANYVKVGGVIDKEAYKRGTSVYFSEKVIPMLPEKLCDDVCSLKQGEERPTLSCVMKVDMTGKVISSKLVEGVIKSSARMTYTEVQKILDGDILLAEKYSKITPMIFIMQELANVLIEKRNKRGSIDLDVKETEIRVTDGKIIINERKRNQSNRIIEEFMILANETVAETMFAKKLPCVYRVHEKPSEEKLNAFYGFLHGIGVEQPKNDDFATVLDSVKDKPIYPIVNRVMLRSMQKAKYSPEDIGHFGLASEHYCHFTSPIRRYPDLVVHRIIKSMLVNGERNLNAEFLPFIDDISKQSSDTERNAELAERAMDDYYKALYMSERIGEEYDGIISGVTNFGIFVELPFCVEGLVRIEMLKGGWYDFDEKNLTLKNKKYSYKFGQSVKIKVAGVDMAAKKAEFTLLQ